MTTVIVVLALSYLVGAVPWSWLFARRAGLDLRHVGSGNLGATNTFRAMGARAALPVLFLDIAKGAVAPLLIARLRLGPSAVAPDVLAALAGLAAITGHIFPVYLKFRGGKGIATAAGVFLVLAPSALLLCVAAFTLAMLATRGIVSVGSLAAATTLPIAVYAVGVWRNDPRPVLLAVAAVACVLLWSKHTSNLRRLVAGTEKRIFDRSAASRPSVGRAR